jgi:hypothetical protein
MAKTHGRKLKMRLTKKALHKRFAAHRRKTRIIRKMQHMT